MPPRHRRRRRCRRLRRARLRSLNYGIQQQKLYLKQPDGSKFSDTAFVLTVACIFNSLCALAWNLVQVSMPKQKVERDEVRPATDLAAAAAASGGADAAGAGGGGGGGTGGGSGGGGSGGGAAAAAPKPFMTALVNPYVMLAAAIYVFAMFSSNESLKYVDYAYQALAKSCKLIPVMLGTILLEGKTYSLTKYASVAGMTAGITAYEFMKDGASGGGKHGSGGGETSTMGIALLALSLVLDGAAGPTMKKIQRIGIFRSDTEVQIAINLWATVYMFVVTAGLGQLGSSATYLRAHPDLLWTLATFSLCSGMGQLFIFYTLMEFDPLTLSTITTTRKFATIVYNAVLLPAHNKLNPHQWGCVSVVFAAVALDAFFDDSKHKEAKELKDGSASPAAGVGAGAGGGGGAGASTGGKAGGAKGDGGTPSKTRRNG